MHPSPHRQWVSGDLTVNVRPELALTINGQPVIVKLWFDVTQALTKPHADPLLQLLDATHGVGAGKTATPAVLEVIRGKLFKKTRDVPGLEALLRGEAACFISMWNALP